MGRPSLGALTWATIALVAIEFATAVAFAAAGAARDRAQQQTRDVNRRLVRELALTDLALSSGTSYTRHPSQADLFAPHGDHPSAIEHFPAGSVMPPSTDPTSRSPSTDTGAFP